VLVSIFGTLAVPIDNTGARKPAKAAKLPHRHDAHRIHAAVDDLGYALIPDELHRLPCDGICGSDFFAPGPATWSW
jgi:hypothetical protein